MQGLLYYLQNKMEYTAETIGALIFKIAIVIGMILLGKTLFKETSFSKHMEKKIKKLEDEKIKSG